jgi:hypothetical protein
MRVGYTQNGNYVVINQLLSIEKQLLPDGNTYLTATGYGVRFITNSFNKTYYADNFTLIINAFGEPEQLKMRDSRNEMIPASYFSNISNDNLDYNFLKRFFIDGESELYSLSVSTFGNQLSASTPAPRVNSSQNSTLVEFYNNSGTDISACYAYYNNEDRCWTSVGWYTVPPYSTKTINIGNYKGDIYIRGRQGLINEWGSGDAQFCVDATQAFNIKFADSKDCWSKKKFSKFSVTPGVNKWTFN